MAATIGKKLRFSDAVYAIETTPKTLRNWLQRKQVVIGSEQRPVGGWADYGFVDIAVLALVSTFVRFGVNVPTANLMAHTTLAFFPDHLEFGHKPSADDAPAGILASPWHNRRLLAYPADPDGEQWKLQIRDLWKDEAKPADAYLSIDVDAVLRRAFARAWESVNEGHDGDDD